MRRALGAALVAVIRRVAARRRRLSVAGPPAGASAGLDAALVETLPEALVVTDPRLTVLHWNGAMESLTGLPRAQAVGRDIHGLSPTLEAVGLPQHLQRARGGEVRFAAEIAGPTAPAQSSTWIEARCVPLREAGGRVLGVAAFLADTTERRRRALFVRAMEAIGRSLASSLDLDEVLDTIVSRARELMEADAALVASWDGKAPAFRVMRAAGRLSAEYAAAGMIPVGGGPISVAVLQGRPVTTANILTDPRLWLTPDRRAEIEREGFRAVAAAPLASKGRVHGALVVHYWAERSLAEEEVMTLSLLAEQAAIAIDNARLYADATRRADRLRELAEVEQLITASLDIDQVLQAIAGATARLVGAPAVHLWTVDPGGRVLRLRAASVSPELPGEEMPATLAVGEGITGLAAERRAPVFVPDASAEARAVHEGRPALATMLAVPILSGERVLGVLTVRATRGELSGEEDQALVTSLAARAALAIENARRYTEAVRRAARLRELAAVSQSITASLDTGDVMRRIAEAAAALTAGAMAAVHVLDDERRVLRYAGRSGPEWESLPQEFAVTEGLPGLVVEQRAPVLVAEPARHPRALAPGWWRERPGASFYGVPIFAGESLVGVLGYVFPEGVPDEEEQEALQLLAAHAGVALRNATLYQAERAQAERVGALAAINQRISSSLDLDDLLRRIAESAAYLAGVRYASFWVADEERRTLTVKGGSVPGIAEDFPQPVIDYAFGGVGWVARHRQPLVVDDVFSDDRIGNRSWWQRWAISAFAAYPVMAADELLAVLVLSHSEPIRFSAETRALIDMFIAQASVAIQNARLYRDAQRRREVAEALARVGREITASLDLERIAGVVARGVVELLGGRSSAVYRYEPVDGTLHVIGASGAGVSLAPGAVLQPGEGVVGRAVTERRVAVTRDVLSEPDITLGETLRQRILASGYRAVVGIPLMVQERIVGALGMTAEQGRVFSREELGVLQAFADQAALALENARLYAAAQDSLARLRDTQAQLVQAAKMSAMGQLVSGVAHELNNPLSVIIGYGQLLLHREVPAPLKRPLELIVSQGDRMAKIVRNLLYFARQRPPERAPVDLNQVIEQALALRANQLLLSGIEVERDFHPTLPPVSGDAQQLQQVFLNLLLNAEQAIASTGHPGRIVFRTAPDDDGRGVRAQVIDDGPGIPPEVLPRVFEPFFTTKEVGAGTGLGLSVSYGIVSEHGGRLGVESEPGRTAFTLELPASPPEATAPESPAPAATPR